MSPGILAILVQDPTLSFTSNTVIIFLPGLHQTNISGNLTVLIKDVRNISMIGDNPTNNLRSVVQCTGLLRFAFMIVTTHLKIRNLIFSSCGAYYPSNLTVIEKFVYILMTMKSAWVPPIITGNLTVLITKYLK